MAALLADDPKIAYALILREVVFARLGRRRPCYQSAVDIEFHYWVTGLLASRAGFSAEEAQTIAHASQYVDDNDVVSKIEGRGQPYENYISQTMNILQPRMDLMRIYPVFHFVPGVPDAVEARRRDGKMHLLNTTPDGPLAGELLDLALACPADSAPYRVGIASHAYIDTWAHQNFVGAFDSFNNIGLDPKPNVGHADAEHHPDWVGHQWIDNRLVESAVDNRPRFLAAAHALFIRYCESLAARGREAKPQAWAQLERDLVEVQGPGYRNHRKQDSERRMQCYRRWLPDFADYHEGTWFQQAIDTQVRGLPDSEEGLLARFTWFVDRHHWKDGLDPRDTHWYRFQEAVKEHQAAAMTRLAGIYAKMGIDVKQTSGF